MNAWESCVQVTKLPSKAVLGFSFLLFVIQAARPQTRFSRRRFKYYKLPSEL